jgi:hypothetical protein
MGPKQEQPALDLSQYEQGFFSKLFDENKTGVSAFEHLMRGMGAAGSPDPMKTMAMFHGQDVQAQEYRDRRKAASKPKVTPLSDGAFSLVSFPDGSTKLVPNTEVMEYQGQQAERQRLGKIDQEVLRAHLNELAKKTGQEVKDASAAETSLKTVQDHLSSIQTARETLPRMEWTDQVKGGAGPVGTVISSFVAPQMNIDSQRRGAVRVMDWVRSSEPLKGALSNVEGLKLDMPLPTATAGREEWEAYLDNSEKVARAAEDYYRRRASGGTAATQPPAQHQPRAPQATAGGLPRVSSDADYAAIPSGSRYVSPDGKIRQKP